MPINRTPKVTLVGAGPGDPDLLTVKGVKALTEADVVLYDALVNTALLEYAPKHAKLVFVGKRKGAHTCSQEEINQRIVRYAFQEGHVVRLKGGDSFVFGRGAEEIDHLGSFGIQVAVVPGISSALAVPAYSGIPMTKRGVSESFWVITGTTSSRKLSEDVRLAARSTATVVVLMGMSKLGEIVLLFQKEGKGDQAVAVIQNGTTAIEKRAVATIDTIEEKVQKQQLSSPAAIVIGEVVKHSYQLNAIFEEWSSINV